MAVYAKDIVRQAQAWIGKKESNNSHKEIIDVYNSHKPLARGYAVKYTDAWCSTFASAVAIKCGATNIIPTECGCEKHIQLFKQMGIWVENENRIPSPGDFIFYDWDDSGAGDNQGYSEHVGIVEKVSGNTFTVIEGNMNNAVGRRTLKVNAKYIRGFGTPKYNTEPSSSSTNTVSKSIEELAKEVIAGKWDVGDARERKLTAAGYDYKAVQNKVNEIYGVANKASSGAFAVGDKVKLASGATYYNGQAIPKWVFNSTLYVREIAGDRVVISTRKTGAITGAVNKKYLKK